MDPDSPANTEVPDDKHERFDRTEASPNRGYFIVGGKVVKAGHRMVRFRSQEVCTAGYAISRRGAQKLLAKTGSHLRGPIDLVIRDMVAKKNWIRTRRIQSWLANGDIMKG